MKIPKDAIAQVYDRVRTSLWFVPGLFVSAAIVLASITPVIDRLMPDAWQSSALLLFFGQPGNARAVLATIATSTIGVAGVVFSMTIVSLQLASAQFGPRLLRTFLRDRGNQVVLGTFLGTFLYCIVMLPAIGITASGKDGVGDGQIPHSAVTISVALAVVCMAMLVYYIDHIAQSIHADAVIHAVGRELNDVIDQLYPGQSEQDSDLGGVRPVKPPDERDAQAISVAIGNRGYVRLIDTDKLLAIAAEHNLVIHAEARAGQFLMPHNDAASLVSETTLSDRVHRSIAEAFVLGAHRTVLQDVLFAFEQASEIALRAMSPSVNDPTTAVHCIDRIGDGIALLVSRPTPSPWRADRNGVARVRIDSVGFADVLESAVVPISRTAGVHLPVWLRLIEVLHSASARAVQVSDKQHAVACAQRLAEHALDELSCDADRGRLNKAAAWTSHAMNETTK